VIEAPHDKLGFAVIDRYLPFLATTKVLMAAVRAGVGRETAHEAIKEHAVAVALAMREQGLEPDLLDRLAADDRLPAGEARAGGRGSARASGGGRAGGGARGGGGAAGRVTEHDAV